MSPENPAVAALANVVIFQGLSPQQIGGFIGDAHQSSYERGAVIFREGDPGTSLMLILEGEIGVFKGSVELARLRQNSVLGEMTLFELDVARTATAIAMTDALVVEVLAARIHQLLAADDTAALKVMANVGRVISKRVNLINEKLVVMMAEKNREELHNFSRIQTNWDF